MAKKQKNKGKKSAGVTAPPEDENPSLPQIRVSDEPVPKKEKWINKQRVLVFAARGINHRDRHLMRDIKSMMPHHRAESKMERSKTLSVVNEMCEMKHCNKAILFEGRRKRDLYMWVANIPNGPSMKFLVENIHTMGELKMTGNCLRGSRPLLSFDSNFETIPHLAVIKGTFVQVFGVPNYHPKSQPFFDHVYTFTFLDNRIWFRNYQILSEDGGLAEIGPRFVLNPIKLFDGSFTGKCLWENSNYVSPSRQRQMLKKVAKDRYVSRLEQKVTQEATQPKHAYKFNEFDDIFEGRDPVEKAEQLVAREQKTKEKQQKTKNKKRLEERIMEKQLSKVAEIIEKKKQKKKFK